MYTDIYISMQHVATHRNTFQRTVPHYDSHVATHCHTLQRATANYNTRYHTAPQCNTL